MNNGGCSCAEDLPTIARINSTNSRYGHLKNQSGDSWELSVTGRIDGAAANELEVEILAATRAGVREVFINLSQAEWICSAGIRVLLQYFRQMKAQGKKLLVTRPSPEIFSILEMTGFKDLIVESGQASG